MADWLPSPKRRDLDERLLLGERDYTALANEFGVSTRFVFNAATELGTRFDHEAALRRYSELEDLITKEVLEGNEPDVDDLVVKLQFPKSLVKREIARVKSILTEPRQVDAETTAPVETLRSESPFAADIGPDFYRGRQSKVVFAPNPTKSRYPALDFLAEMYDAGGEPKARALALRAMVQAMADGGSRPAESTRYIHMCNIIEFKVFKFRLFAKPVTLEDEHGERRVIVLLGGCTKKRDKSDEGEFRRAERNYVSWIDTLEEGTRVKNPKGRRRNPEDIDWNKVDQDNAVQMCVIRLVLDIQAVLRDVMAREGIDMAQLASHLHTTEANVERTLWDVAPLERLAKVANALGVTLGAREVY